MMELLANYKTKAPLEKMIQHHITVWLRQQGYHIDVITKGMYGNNGIADIICCIDGRYIAFEVKRPGKKPTPIQQSWAQKVKKAGGEYYTVHSLDEVKELFE